MHTIDIEKLDSDVRAILSDNAKLQKMPTGETVINAGITMAPSKRSKVVNVCPHATAACILVCVLWFAGRTVTKTVRAAATKRTRLWFYASEVFYSRLRKELASLARRATKRAVKAYCRLNVASDIAHPLDIVESFPSVGFYDYTADAARAKAYGMGEFPSNYHVSFSVKESTTYDDAKTLHSLGVNLVTVFDSYYFGPLHRYGILPKTVVYRSRKTGETFKTDTVDGDVHDIRIPHYDGKGKTVALRAKGSKSLRERAASMGFIRHHDGGEVYRVGEHNRDGIAIVDLD